MEHHFQGSVDLLASWEKWTPAGRPGAPRYFRKVPGRPLRSSNGLKSNLWDQPEVLNEVSRRSTLASSSRRSERFSGCYGNGPFRLSAERKRQAA